MLTLIEIIGASFLSVQFFSNWTLRQNSQTWKEQTFIVSYSMTGNTYTKNVLLRTICILNYNHCIIKNPLRKNNFAFVERQSYVLTVFCEKIMEKTHLFECVVRFGGANWSMAKASLSAVLLILFLVLVLDLWKDATSFYLYYISVFSCKYFCLTCKM